MKIVRKAYKALRYLKRYGLRATLKKIKRVLFHRIELVEHYTKEDLEALSREAEQFGITTLVGLWQELAGSLESGSGE